MKHATKLGGCRRITATIAGAISMLAQLGMFFSRFGGNRGNNGLGMRRPMKPLNGLFCEPAKHCSTASIVLSFAQESPRTLCSTFES
jgi:hypothetical protein